MAHDPVKRASAVADIVANGLGWDAVAEKYKVSKSTLKSWVDEAKTEQKPNSGISGTELIPIGAEARKARFEDALTGFLMSTVTMLRCIAETCSDPAFIQKDPAGVNDLAITVFDRAERIMAVVRGEQPAQSPSE